MAVLKKRATIYFDPDIHRVLKFKSASTNKSISELIDIAIRYELAEDEEDIRTFKEREKESTISFESVLKDLKDNGKI
ncbi:CopG family transcriptional regulator [candidate division KSB1 bacterium]|nr:CopG family transcriptional regulator [candidate division KSB1 bacterium]